MASGGAVLGWESDSLATSRVSMLVMLAFDGFALRVLAWFKLACAGMYLLVCWFRLIGGVNEDICDME